MSGTADAPAESFVTEPAATWVRAGPVPVCSSVIYTVLVETGSASTFAANELALQVKTGDANASTASGRQAALSRDSVTGSIAAAMKGRLHRIAAHLALAALLLKALLPTVTAALEGLDRRLPSGSLALCTPSGLQQPGAVDPDHSAPAGGSAGSAAHCPYCPLQTVPAVLPESCGVALADSSRACPRPTRLLDAPCAACIWAATRARAPPVLT